MTNTTDINQIIIIAIIIAASIIVLLIIFFLITYLIRKSHNKKDKTRFDPSNLVEEDSLIKAMEEKRNVEFKQSPIIQNQDRVNQVNNEPPVQNTINPFGIDMTTQNNNKDTENNTYDIPNNNNKFIK